MPARRLRSSPARKSPAPAASGGSNLAVPALKAEVRTLDNGLDVIVREDHEHPLVSVQIWIKAGSLHEEKWTGAGLAHCVEHMLFKGTVKRSASQISQGIQELGGYVNAYTTFNRTVYWIDGLADQTEGYLDILADMVRHSKIDPLELQKEQDVIRREMAMDNDDAGSVVQHLVQSTSFRKHPLKHPIIGHRAVFDQVSRDDVAGFVSRHYVPNNCFVVIAGAVNAEECFAAAQRLLGDWERRPYEPILLPEEAPQRGLREGRKNFDTELTRLALGWQIPGEGHQDKAALDVLAFLLGSGRSSRLYQELREKRSIAHWVWAGAWGAPECGVFNTEAECDPKDVEACQKAMLEVIETLKAKGPTVAELAKAVRATIGGQVRTLATTKGQAASLGSSWLNAGTLDHAQHYLAAVRALTPTAIRDAARRYLTPASCSVAMVGPDVETTSASTHTTTTKNAIQRFVLPNGLTLLIGENPRLPLVSIRASFLAGVPAETAANGGATQVSAALLLKGTKTRTAAEIASELENLGGSLQCTADAHRYLLGSDVMRGDEAKGLNLIADLIQNATLPAAQLKEVQKRQIASILEEKEDPLTVAMRHARKEIFAGTPFARTALGTEESVKALKVETCRAMLSKSLVGANGVISIHGDIKAATVRKQVEKALGKLKKGTRHYDAQAAFPVTAEVKPGQHELHMDKEQAIIVIGFRTVGLHHPDSQALALIDEACSDMGSRLFNRIREELGLAYYVGAQQFSALGAGAFYFYVGTSAEKAALAQQEILVQIEDLVKNGLTADEIQRSKTTWRSGWLRAQQGNGSLADVYGWNELNGLGYENFSQLPAKVEALTDEDLRRVARTYFSQASAHIVTVMPEVQ
ncbi:zinc protease [Prosthecobacter fusiformis]|uniref:Zinc protease n=1 Tax=Prosthecobacter fusiformis TaxID=48464 RepID=A0A4R7RRK8_9BACT|nr:pitrilysin family protein [Prosthecobacter fusiformis]TDU68160.1 zinc protease [Prosthecobacter fusiformis]